MKKGLIAFSIISLIVLSGITLAQMDSVDCSFCEWAKQVLKRLISIDDKICSEEPIVLYQETINGPVFDVFSMNSPDIQGEIAKRNFLLVFPQREGELVSINGISVYGYIHSRASKGSTCEIYINNVLCLTYVKTLPQDTEDEHFYEELPQSCIDVLDFDGINEIEMTCPILSGMGWMGLYKINYDAIWKSC